MPRSSLSRRQSTVFPLPPQPMIAILSTADKATERTAATEQGAAEGWLGLASSRRKPRRTGRGQGGLSDFQTDATGERRKVGQCSTAVGAQEVGDHAVDRGPVADVGG